MLFCESIIEGVLLIILLAATFYLGWIIATLGLISNEEFDSLNNEKHIAEVYKRTFRMMQMHFKIMFKRLKRGKRKTLN